MLVPETIANKVYHVIADHEFGGGTVHTARLIRALNAKDGTWTHVAVLPVNSDEETRGTFLELPSIIGDYRGRHSPFAIARCILRLAHRGDIVHAQGTRAAVGVMLASLINRQFRSVYTVHGFHGLRDPDLLRLRVLIERCLASCIDVTTFVSYSDICLAEQFNLPHKAPRVLINYGVPVPLRDTNTKRDIDLLFVGRLVRQKWPEAFVKTVACLPEHIRVVMVGDGELNRSVEELILRLRPQRIERIKACNHDAILALMSRSRLLVMTSRWEGLPLVAIEAAQSGALVVGFSIDPLVELLGSIASETLTPADPRILADCIVALLSDEGGRVSKAAVLEKTARQRYSLARMAQRYSELYSRFD
jgi:glycosyltransferase involved in cell wall biosynthesis